MKNQYFGDINDYKKYGLLRILSDEGRMRTGVCWMLTQDDGGTHGSKTKYLKDPRKWRHYDPDLFDFLVQQMDPVRARGVGDISRSQIVSNAIYFNEILTDDRMERKKYFENVLGGFSQNLDLIFFDPDIGFEVNSKPVGRKGSSKYVYWDELKAAYDAGHSLLVYQHFPQFALREPFIARLTSELQKNIGAKGVIAFKTSNVLFFLAVQERHKVRMEGCAKRVVSAWGKEILYQIY
ncbi:MAG: hypothetical protein NTU47_04055 [Ignavibacteriales bacterium]|nr:hypothetical protein [Ignavibacteriales bacterium]